MSLQNRQKLYSSFRHFPVGCILGLQEKIDVLINKISEEKRAGNTLDELIRYHESVLSDLIEAKSVPGNTNYLETHEKIEYIIEKYFRKYQKLKRHILKL